MQVEKLLEDFEKRKAEAGENADTVWSSVFASSSSDKILPRFPFLLDMFLPAQIEKTRAYLGGDATHSILVKGLDYALLAARKAELQREGEEIADEELEALLEDRGRGTKAEKGRNGKKEGKEGKSEERLNNRVRSQTSLESRKEKLIAPPSVQVDRAERGRSGSIYWRKEEEEEKEEGEAGSGASLSCRSARQARSGANPNIGPSEVRARTDTITLCPGGGSRRRRRYLRRSRRVRPQCG